MFNILDIVWYKCNFNSFGQSILKKMKTEKAIKSEEEFYNRYGIILMKRCTFEQGYNDIISDAYETQFNKYGDRYTREIENLFEEIFDNDLDYGRTNFYFFLTEGVLWCSCGNTHIGAKWGLAALLTAYILSQHCDISEYKNITKLALLSSGGRIDYFDIEDISDKTLSMVCRNMIGYITPKETSLWRESYGTNIDKQISLYQHHEIDVSQYREINKPKKVELKESQNSLILSYELKKELTEFCNFSKNRIKNIDIYYISDIHLDYDIDILEEKAKNLFTKLLDNLRYNKTNESYHDYMERIKNSYFFILGDTASDIKYLQRFLVVLRDLLKRKYHSFENLYVVLGNHEFISFDTIEEGVHSSEEFSKTEDVNILFNTIKKTEDFVIVGGTGFAKYNNEFNANNIICAKKFTRDDEIKESELFYNLYLEALELARLEEKPLIVLTHYPVKDWLEKEKTHKNCYYFSGHTHRNVFIEKEDKIIIADNQVGYKERNPSFRKYVIGVSTNPFKYYEDGCYEVKISQYDEFIRYLGDYYRGSSHIENVLSSETAKFYMIKVWEYYGFFIIDTKKDAKICYKGIGKIIKHTKGKDIDYFYNRFLAMIKMQVSCLSGYYNALLVISKEVKKIGLNGEIHGCIVDLDRYNHIMLNPLDGTLTYYYSPNFGYVKTYESFEKLLKESMINTLEETKYNSVLTVYNVLNRNNNSLIIQGNVISNSQKDEIEKIEIKGSMYSVSREMKKYQALFELNVLTVWDEVLLKDTPFELEGFKEIE